MNATVIPTPVERRIDDCWNRIGVHGDGSCVELAAQIHCRNCPVYSAAALQVLDRERPQESLDAIARLYARPLQDADAGVSHSAFIFRVAGEWLALSASMLDEVADLRAIHSLPHRRNGIVLGLANVRGELLVCVSIAQLLGLDAGAQSVPPQARQHRIAQKRLLVLHKQGSRMAVPVDEVHGMQRYEERELRPVPATVAKATASYSKAILPWRDHAVGLLDDELLFHSFNRSLA